MDGVTMAEANIYVTCDFKIDEKDPIIISTKKATDIAKAGKIFLDMRTLVSIANPAALVKDDVADNPYTQIRLNMSLYLNYLQLLRNFAISNNMNEPLSLMRLGYIPIICEPSFTYGIYGSYIEPFLRATGIPLYARNQVPFTRGKISLTGTDYWVSKLDCCKYLNMGDAPHLVTAEAILRNLGVNDYDTDIRILCRSNGG